MFSKGPLITTGLLIIALLSASLGIIRERSISASLRAELAAMNAEAARLERNLEGAAEAEREAAAERSERYDALKERVFNEPDARDGAVSPALRDLIGGLPG